jgi:hypothetical protein
MTIDRLNYLLTGTEQPRGVTEREKTIIKECAKIITDIEQLHKPVVMRPALESVSEGELLGNEAVAKGVSVEMCSCGAIGVTTRHGIDQCEECGKPA